VFFFRLEEAQAQVIENYNSMLQVQEEKNWFFPPSVAKVEVNLNQFPILDMAIALPANSSLFVDGKLWFFTQADTSFVIATQELINTFPSPQASREFLIYNPEIRTTDISLTRGIYPGEVSDTLEPEGQALSVSRVSNETEDFFLLAVLILFSLIALFKIIYPLVITFIIRPVFAFSSEDFFESHSLTRFFSVEILYFLLIFNMLLMLLIIISAYYLERIGLESIWSGDLNHMFFIWLFGTGVLLLLSLVKFLWLKITAIVFGINKIEFTHFFYMLRIALLIMLVICTVIFISQLNGVLEMERLIGFLWMCFFILYTLGIFLLYFTMTKKVSLKYYHLFSYLCTAELVPFLVFSKLLMG
jgi:hypothetical protein